MTTQTFHYSAASCGSGKTTWAINRMATQPARYVYAVDRTDQMTERTNLILRTALDAGFDVRVTSLSSRGGDVVTRDFPDNILRLSTDHHAVLIITHEAMKRVDHKVVESLGWTIIIDEDPKIWSSSSFDLAASQAFWASNYTLQPTELRGYSLLLPKTCAPTWKAALSDQMTAPLATFLAKAARGETVVNLVSWADLPERQRMAYYMIWDASELTAYDDVIFLANSFDRLVTYRLIRSQWGAIELKPLQTSAPREWVRRRLTINYVAADHVASTNFFENTLEGEKAIEAWKAWVSATVNAKSHFYAVNKARGSLHLPGVQVSPKIAGSNLYREFTQVSVLYTAKASSVENMIFSDMTRGAISPDDVRRDREFEDLIQIVFRSSLRMPDDTRDVVVNVYDSEQAEFLASYFRDAGFGFDIALNFVDLALSRTFAKRGRKPDATKAPVSAAERARRYREKKRAALAAQVEVRP